MTAEVVEGADLFILASDEDDRGAGGLDLLGEVAARPAGSSSIRATLSQARLKTASRSSS